MDDITSFLVPAASSRRRRRKKPITKKTPAPVLVVETVTTVTTASSTSVYTPPDDIPEEEDREIAVEDSKRKAAAIEEEEEEEVLVAPAPKKKTKKKKTKKGAAEEEEEEELSYAQLKAKLRKTELALAQSKRSRVYTLPGAKQLIKWVEACPDFYEEVRGDAQSAKSRMFYMDRLMPTAVIMMAQYGGDPARFALTVTVNAKGRTETVDDEEEEDYGEEYELAPYALRLNLSQGNISFHQEGLISGRSRYLYGNAPLEDQGQGILSACKEEFHVPGRAMLLLFAHCLEFIPLQTRRAYVATLAPGSLMKEAMDVCHCFDDKGNKKSRKSK